MTVVREHAGLIDTWGSLHAPSAEESRKPMSPEDALTTYGLTYDSSLNTFCTRGTIIPQGKRLDYILFRNPWHPSTSPLPLRLVHKDARVALTEHIPGQSFSYSDHFGVEALFEIEGSESLNPGFPSPALIDHTDVPTLPSTTLTTKDKSNLSTVNALAMLDALKARLRLSKARSRQELRIYAGCVAALVGLLVGTGWSPKGFLTPVFVFVGALATWLGTTMFYVGLMYGGWEASILQNLIEEIELYVKALQDGSS
jgi:sphingomyelin phosphodiesterase 2